MSTATLVIATHERPRHFQRALESALEAVARAPEPVPIAVLVSAAEPPVVPDGVWLEHRPDLRTAVAKRRRAFDIAHTPWLLFLDDDCVLTPDAVGVMLATIAEQDGDRTGAMFVVTEFIGPRTRCFDAALHSDLMAGFDYANFGGDLMWGTTSLSAFRRAAVLEVGAFPAGELPLFAGGEDVDACLRLRRAGWRLHGIPETLAHHTTETWSTFGDNLRRSRNYGAAEAELVRIHPDNTRIGYENLAATAALCLAAQRLAGTIATRSVAGALAGWLAGEVTELADRHREATTAELVLQLAWSLAYELGRLSTATRRRRPSLALRRFDWEAAEPVEHPFALPRGLGQRVLVSTIAALALGKPTAGGR
jgi:hypothetical protein